MTRRMVTRFVRWADRTGAFDGAAILIASWEWGLWGVLLALVLIVPVNIVAIVVTVAVDLRRRDAS